MNADDGRIERYPDIPENDRPPKAPSAPLGKWSEPFSLGETIDFKGVQMEIIKIKKARKEIHLRFKGEDGKPPDEEIIKLFKDGDQWCALYGINLQEGVTGFGKTKTEAIINLAREMINPEDIPEDSPAVAMAKLHEWITNNVLEGYLKEGEDPVDTAIRIMGNYLDSHGARKQ